jgi:5-methylcytosine-specific restriction endonuclease McrA
MGIFNIRKFKYLNKQHSNFLLNKKYVFSDNVDLIIFDDDNVLLFSNSEDDKLNDYSMYQQLLAEKIYPEFCSNQISGLIFFNQKERLYKLRRIKARAVTDSRRLRKKKIIVNYTISEWRNKLRLSDGVCLMCNVAVGIENLTLDHIYPVRLAYIDYCKTGRSRVYTIDDIQPLCRNCNSRKSASFDGEHLSFKIPRDVDCELSYFTKKKKRIINVEKLNVVKSEIIKSKVSYSDFVKSLNLVQKMKE